VIVLLEFFKSIIDFSFLEKLGVVMEKVGSQGNPLKLVPDVSRRLLLEITTGIGVDDDGPVTVFSRMKERKQSFDLYIKNLMRNSALSAIELRLGYLLFDLLDNEFSDAVFLLVENSRYRMSKVGDDGILYLHDKRQVSSGVEILEKQSLLELSQNANIDLDSKSLINSLNRLHSFFYITCTEVSEANTPESRRGYNYEANEVLLSDTAEITHIRLNQRFAKYDLTKKWVGSKNYNYA
tara:strand:- start:1185 stop:1898 length:714 start_codon:yes stop_codon:yes gene_type:complete